MGFQTTVSLVSGGGVVGEFYADDPRRAQSYILNSVSAANNVFGRAFTVVDQGIAQAGNPSAGVFAGILVNPKASVSRGTQAGGPLAPTLTLANNEQADLATMGTLFVSLPAAADIGDLVIYDNTTGELSTIAPGDNLPSGKSFAYATVSYFTVSGAGLAVITLTPTLSVPVPA